jgi:hypothetical protein
VQLPLMMNWTAAALKNADFILSDLQVFPDAMARNLALSKGLIVSEAFMMGLGEFSLIWDGSDGRIFIDFVILQQALHLVVNMLMMPCMIAAEPHTLKIETSSTCFWRLPR